MNKKGFTLIELLGVILIISLLVIIVLPRITNSVQNFNSKTDKLIMNMIEDAAKLYVEDNSSKFEKKNGSNYCIQINELVNKKYLKGPIEYGGKDITNTKGLKVKYNNGFEYELSDLYKGSCTLGGYIKNLYNPTITTTVNGIEYDLDETHLLMNDRLGNKDVAKTDGNIRYYGANPNNYIDIGDRDSKGNIIFWRIIGVFKDVEVTDENENVIKIEDLVKIIRADFLTSGDVTVFSWDYTSLGEDDNNWNDSTLQVMLNDEENGYYASGITNYYNYQEGKVPTPITLDFTSLGLSKKTHSKIESVKWSLGGHNINAVYANAIYGYERTGVNKWSGKIALIYPSDYGYSVDLSSCQVPLSNYQQIECTSTNWIYYSKAQLTLTPISTSLNLRYGVHSTGYLNNGRANRAYGVRPVLYLKSDVSIVEEKETSEGLKYYVVE